MEPSSSRFVRWGGACGLAMVAVVFAAAVVGPALIGVGEPPGSFATEAQVRAYFGHADIAAMQLSGPLFAVLGLVFVAAVRERTRGEGPPWGDLALAAVVILLAGLMVEMALTIALVRQAGAGGEVMLLFRVYDVFYNYFLELAQGALVLFLALAAFRGYPRWVAWSGLGLAAFHPVMALRTLVPLPEAFHAVGMLWFVAWFVVLAALTARPAEHGAAARASAGHAAPR